MVLFEFPQDDISIRRSIKENKTLVKFKDPDYKIDTRNQDDIEFIKSIDIDRVSILKKNNAKPYSVVELKDIAKRLGLKVSGNKENYVSTILKFVKNHR